MFRLATRSFAAPLARQAVATPLRFPVQQRFYAASSLSQESIKARIEDVLKSFEKVDATKVSTAITLPGLASLRRACCLFSVLRTLSKR